MQSLQNWKQSETEEYALVENKMIRLLHKLTIVWQFLFKQQYGFLWFCIKVLYCKNLITAMEILSTKLQAG